MGLTPTAREELLAGLWARFLAVSRRMQPGLSVRGRGSQLESEYSSLYDQIAKLGAAPRLRKKYRC